MQNNLIKKEMIDREQSRIKLIEIKYEGLI